MQPATLKRFMGWNSEIGFDFLISANSVDSRDDTVAGRSNLKTGSRVSVPSVRGRDHPTNRRSNRKLPHERSACAEFSDFSINAAGHRRKRQNPGSGSLKTTTVPEPQPILFAAT